MDYRTGSIGRVLMIRLDHGDDLLGNLKEIVVKETIKSAWFQIVGGIRQAGVVTGPKQPIMPPEPVWRDVDEAREVVGSGSIFMDGEEPRIHLHAAMGHHGDTLTACIRKHTKVYLILEVILFELSGIDADRPWYEEGGFNRLTFS
jgi:predicted DNA-binding protein with PD1-like motif